MMFFSLLLSSLLSVIYALGWSEPIITVDTFTTTSYYNTLQITGSNTLHQSWGNFNQESRVGYKSYLPDGTVLFPETMISRNLWSNYPTSCLVNEDSVAIFWREGGPAWYCLRASTGEELLPAANLIPESYVTRPYVEASSDSLGRIHVTSTTPKGLSYFVFEPGVGEVFRDILSTGYNEISNICVDGNRVHIFFQSAFAEPSYIQYDLDGNVVIPQVILVNNIDNLESMSSSTIDNDSNFWCFIRYHKPGPSGYLLAAIKVDAETGDVLVVTEIDTWPDLGNWFPTILKGPNDTLYLMWLAYFQSDHYVYFAIIDNEGNFIEEPYVAYDYSEGDQSLSKLEATTNSEGDIFAIWTRGDYEVGGHWIVMGSYDPDLVGVEESTTIPVNTDSYELLSSANPFTETVIITVEGNNIPDILEVFDTSGRVVRSLLQNNNSVFFWNGLDSRSNELPAGVYTIRGVSDSCTASVQVVKL